MNNRPTRLIAIAALALGAAACTNKGSVMGEVFLDRDNRPIRNARVVLTPADSDKRYETTADWGGNYVIHVKEGAYTIAAEHPGLTVCDPGPQPLEVRGNQVESIGLCLTAEGAAAVPADTLPAAAPASATPAAEPAGPTGPIAGNDSPQPTTPAAAGAQGDGAIEVSPLPDQVPVTASQYPPSAAPAYPPAPGMPQGN